MNTRKSSAKTIKKELKDIKQIKQFENMIGNSLKPIVQNYMVSCHVIYQEDADEFKIYIYMRKGTQLTSIKKKGIRSQIMRAVDKIKNQHGIHYSISFENKVKNTFEFEISQEVLNLIIKNVLFLTLPPSKQTDLIKKCDQKTYEEKLTLIHEHLNLFLTACLKEDFPTVCANNPPTINPTFSTCYDLSVANFKKYTDRMTGIVKNLHTSIQQYAFATALENEDDTELFLNFGCLTDLIRNNECTLLEAAHRLFSAKTLMEDSVEEYNLLSSKMKKGLSQFNTILKTYPVFTNIFSNIAGEDIINVLGTNLIYKDFSIEPVKEFINCYEKDLVKLQVNIFNIQSGINSIEKNLSQINSQIELEDIRIQTENFNKQEKIVTPKRKNTNEVLKHTSHSIANDITQKPSVEENLSVTYGTLFSTRSLTSDYKKEALDRIRKMEEKQKQRENRNKEKQVNSIFPNTEKRKNDEDKPLIRISGSEKTIEAEIFPLGERTMHLYLCSDTSLVKSNDVEQLAAFQKTASLCKILKRNSLGSNGVKVYGSDFLIVKSKSNNQKNKVHLIFFPVPIAGTKKIVFVATDVISHADYKNYINNRAALKQHAEICMNSITINVVPISAVNEDVYFRTAFVNK